MYFHVQCVRTAEDTDKQRRMFTPITNSDTKGQWCYGAADWLKQQHKREGGLAEVCAAVLESLRLFKIVFDRRGRCKIPLDFTYEVFFFPGSDKAASLLNYLEILQVLQGEKLSGCVWRIKNRTFLCKAREFGRLEVSLWNESKQKPRRHHAGERRSVRGEEEEEARSENVSFNAVKLLFSLL